MLGPFSSMEEVLEFIRGDMDRDTSPHCHLKYNFRHFRSAKVGPRFLAEKSFWVGHYKTELEIF